MKFAESLGWLAVAVRVAEISSPQDVDIFSLKLNLTNRGSFMSPEVSTLKQQGIAQKTAKPCKINSSERGIWQPFNSYLKKPIM